VNDDVVIGWTWEQMISKNKIEQNRNTPAATRTIAPRLLKEPCGSLFQSSNHTETTYPKVCCFCTSAATRTPASASGGQRSIQLSYRGISKGILTQAYLNFKCASVSLAAQVHGSVSVREQGRLVVLEVERLEVYGHGRMSACDS
jgi:hypothetical protein